MSGCGEIRLEAPVGVVSSWEDGEKLKRRGGVFL